MTPESPLPEFPIHAPPRAEPAWNVGDILLILLFGFLSLIITAGIGMAIAHATPSLQFLTRQEVATNPTFFIPVQFIAYLVTFIFTRMLITVRAQQDFWTAVKWNMPGLTAAAGYVFAGVMLAISVQIAARFLPIPKSLPIDRYFRDPGFAYMMLAFGVLVAPLVEEVLFRGLIFPVAKRGLGLVGGTVVTAFIFSVVHQSQLAGAWAPLLVLFGVGLVLTAVRARTNSVAASWIMHFSYNATLFGLLLLATSGFRHLEKLAE